MKKSIYLSLFALMTLLLSFSKADAYNITGHGYYDYCTCKYITINTNVPGYPAFSYKVELSYGDGTTDTSYCDSMSSAGRCHNYATTGSYTIKAVLLDPSLNRIDSSTYTQVVTGCTWMYGYLYHDVNTNCSFDAGDNYFYGYAKIEVDSGTTPIDTIDAYASFFYKALGIGKTYTFKILTSSIGGLTAACPSGGSITATSSSSYTHVGDFGFQCSSSTSFDVAVHPYVIGSPYKYVSWAYITNNSCNTKSGAYSITIDSRYTHIITTYPAGASVSGSTITWSYTGLDVDHPQSFYVYAHGDSTSLATIGSALTTTIDVTPTSGDADTTNNHWTCTDTVKMSWDPNEKTVSPQGNVPAGTTLTYTLKFENTGNAPAENIHIQDTLSSNLDASSLQVITSTHPVTFTRTMDAGKTVIKFDFANIHLLDSSHHGQADGFVMFSIKTKTSLTTGTTIDNRAGIYFDANPVVMTNTVENTIHPLAVPVLNSNSTISIYPNPAHNEFTVKTEKGAYDNLQIINTMGQVMQQQKLINTETHLNIRSLTPGIYYILLKGSTGVKVEKIEKL